MRNRFMRKKQKSDLQRLISFIYKCRKTIMKNRRLKEKEARKSAELAKRQEAALYRAEHPTSFDKLVVAGVAVWHYGKKIIKYVKIIKKINRIIYAVIVIVKAVKKYKKVQKALEL